MRLFIVVVTLLLSVGDQCAFAWESMLTPQQDCELLRQAEHYLSIRNFARCTQAIQEIRSRCRAPECIERAAALQRQCEALAVETLLGVQSISDETPVAVSRADGVDDAIQGAANWREASSLAPKPESGSVAGQDHGARTSALPSQGDESERKAAAPVVDTGRRDANVTEKPGMAMPLLPWILVAVMCGAIALQALLSWSQWKRLAAMAREATGANAQQGRHDGRDVFAEIMLNNVRLRRTEGGRVSRADGRAATESEQKQGSGLWAASRQGVLPGGDAYRTVPAASSTGRIQRQS